MWILRPLFCFLALSLGLASCQPDSSSSPSQNAGSQSAPSKSAPTRGSELRRSLAAVNGKYTLEGAGQRYVFSHKAELEQIISSAAREGVLAELVDCIDDMTASKSELNGMPVPVGVVCYEALSQLAYHEPTDARGDIAKSRPGHILPTATADELRAAKEAWKGVLAAKT